MTTATVLFLDLSGFTALTDVHGDHAAVDIADRFIDAVGAAAEANSGRLLKALGDGALLVLDEPGAAIRTADEISHRLHDLGAMPEMTGGVATGPVIDRDDDVFGATVNLAARLADLAPPGELRTDEPTARAASADEWQIEPLGPTDIRGFHEPRPLFRVLLCHPDDCVTDPICGMRITPGPSTPTLDAPDGDLWFCSTACLDRHHSTTRPEGDR